MEEKYLQEIGLSQNEAKAYLAMLEMGSSPAGEIAKKCRLHRANTYDAIEKLVERGLASYSVQKKTKYFESSPPEALIRYIKQKEVQLDKIMPRLNILAGMQGKKSEACVLEGKKALIDLFYSFLPYKETIYAFGATKEAVQVYLKWDMDKYHQERIAQKITMLHIYNENATKRIKHLNSLPYTEARFLPGALQAKVTIIVCGDTVLFVIWGEPITIIKIRNRNAADVYRSYFDVLWTHCIKSA